MGYNCCHEQIYSVITEFPVRLFCSERMGWIPLDEEISRNLIDKYKLVVGLSVTEMEIIHAAYRPDNPNCKWCTDRYYCKTKLTILLRSIKGNVNHWVIAYQWQSTKCKFIVDSLCSTALFLIRDRSFWDEASEKLKKEFKRDFEDEFDIARLKLPKLKKMIQSKFEEHGVHWVYPNPLSVS